MNFFNDRILLTGIKVFLALLLTFLIMLLIPLDYAMYRAKIVSQEKVGYNSLYYYLDLDYDGVLERIDFHFDARYPSSILSLKEEMIINQWKLHGECYPERISYFDDWDENGQMDLFVFTEFNDSLFLNILEPGRQNSENRVIFVDKISKVSGTRDYNISVPGILDLNQDGQKEIVFSVFNGWSTYPRNLYSVTLTTGEIKMSPDSYSSLYNSRVWYSPEADGHLFYGDYAAHGNGPEDVLYSDHQLWFRVFNMDFEDQFTPVLLGEWPSQASSILLKYGDEHFYFVLIRANGQDSPPSTLAKISSEGELIKKTELGKLGDMRALLFAETKGGGGEHIYILHENGKVSMFNLELQLLSESKVEPWEEYLHYHNPDLDKDGQPEHFLILDDGSGAVIYRENFKHPAKIPFSYPGDYSMVTTFLDSSGKATTELQIGDMLILFQYGLNLSRYWFLLIIPVVFSLFYGLITIAFMAQKRQLQVKKRTHDQMVHLLAENICNQFNPHFTFNLLNTIAGLQINKEHDKAISVLHKYSSILRSNLIHANAFEITLKEELENVRNFLDIELIKFDNAFTYSIEVDDGLSGLIIPKSFLVSFVENAVKHGLRHQHNKPRLIIQVIPDGKSVSILIMDNGPGTTLNNLSKNNSTSRGFEIADKTIELFSKIKNQTIRYSFDPAMDTSPETFSVVRIVLDRAKA